MLPSIEFLENPLVSKVSAPMWSSNFPKLSAFINLAVACLIVLLLMYLVHSVLRVCILDLGHLGQTWSGGYLLAGANYYKPLPTPEDELDDAAELQLANEAL